MNRFVCPKCKVSMEAIAMEVAHRCPSNKSKMTQFDLQGKALTKEKK